MIVVAALALVFTQRSMTEEEIVRRAILGSGSASCTFVDHDANEEFDIFFKDGKVKMNGAFDGHEFFLVTSEENVYIWDTATNEGIFFPISESLEMGVHRFDDREAFFEDIKDKVVNCSAEAISDEAFEIPEEISFHTFDPNDLGFEMEDLDLEEIEDLDLEAMEGSESE